jgi:hypothetical protein
MEKISEEEWEKFFEIMQFIVDARGMTWQEKAEYVRGKASAEGCSTVLDEFAGWFPN